MHEEINGTPGACAVGVATVEIDRLACLAHGSSEDPAHAGPGRVTTKQFELLGSGLELNVDTTRHGHGGHVVVEVLDTAGRAIPGYSAADATACVGDRTRLKASWSKPLSALIGRTVALRFLLTRAQLCAFQVTK